MKMRSLQENMEKASIGMQQPYFPSFTVTDKQLPEANDWEVGKTYKVMLEVRQSSVDKRQNQPTRYGFEMVKIGVHKKV